MGAGWGGVGLGGVIPPAEDQTKQRNVALSASKLLLLLLPSEATSCSSFSFLNWAAATTTNTLQYSTRFPNEIWGHVNADTWHMQLLCCAVPLLQLLLPVQVTLLPPIKITATTVIIITIHLSGSSCAFCSLNCRCRFRYSNSGQYRGSQLLSHFATSSKQM